MLQWACLHKTAAEPEKQPHRTFICLHDLGTNVWQMFCFTKAKTMRSYDSHQRRVKSRNSLINVTSDPCSVTVEDEDRKLADKVKIELGQRSNTGTDSSHLQPTYTGILWFGVICIVENQLTRLIAADLNDLGASGLTVNNGSHTFDACSCLPSEPLLLQFAYMKNNCVHSPTQEACISVMFSH